MNYVVDTLVGAPSANVRFICINGILTNPGDADGWTDRAVTWLNVRTDAQCEKFEYATGALTRRLLQNWRAGGIAKMAGYYIAKGCEVVLVGHSNGCDLAARVLDILAPARIRSAHLFAAATDGASLSRALNDRQLGALHLYGSRKDRALQFAGVTAKLLNPLGLGYGDLGRRVDHFAANNNPIGGSPVVFAHNDDTQDHSSWFERGENFERTMRAIVANEFPS